MPATSANLSFSLAVDGDELRVTDPVGVTRALIPPWKVDNEFWLALHFYDRLTRESAITDAARADLFARATKLGSLLFGILFDEDGRDRLRRAMMPGQPPPLIMIHSDDDSLLALPWELLFDEGSFLLRDARVDLVRSTPGEVGSDAALREPGGFLNLVVNVSAPEGSGLDYEGESYRITKALSEQCRFVPTELGTVEDLIETVRVEKPTAIHFSGHGAPGALVFEDDEGRADKVAIHDLLQRLRTRIDGPLPPLFYLASCHGNDIEGINGVTSAAFLHREGVPQVVGYDGPIVDVLSTCAEAVFYRALAEGGTTRYAVQKAREALAAPVGDADTDPFAWAQLVHYHRGPDRPLSLPVAQIAPEENLQRTFIGVGDRRVLTTGFIGRRSNLHEVRRRIRRGDRVFVFQGLGGLGKSTLAFHVLPMLQHEEGEILTLWCQEVEQQPDRLEGLVTQLLDFCRKKFGLDWEQVVYQVDRQAGEDSLQRFSYFLQAFLQNVPRLVIYLDNLESLQIGPTDLESEGDPEAIGEWAAEGLGQLWEFLVSLTQQVDKLRVVASCRYQNPRFGSALLPVSPLPPDALLRMMGWFPSLRRLHFVNRALLGERLAGHPRAVEYAEDLVSHALARWEERRGPFKEGNLWLEWSELVEQLLPKVEDKLRANLLLAEIWKRVLTDRERRMLYRMTLLRRPWEWSLIAVLGDEKEGDDVAFATAKRLRRASLLEQIEVLVGTAKGGLSFVCYSALHPTTIQPIRKWLDVDAVFCKAVHLRVGNYLEVEAKKSLYIDTGLEAGYHLFGAGEYERAYELLGSISDWLQENGQARRALLAVEPFLAEEARAAMESECVERLLGTIGRAYLGMDELDKAISYYEKSLSIAHDLRNPRGEASNLSGLGVAYAALGETDKAIACHTRGLAIHREIGNREGEANALGNLSNAYFDVGNLEASVKLVEEQLSIAREIGDLRMEGRALGSLGTSYLRLENFDRARGYFEQYLKLARETGDRSGEGIALENIGSTCSRIGDQGRAVEYFEQSLVIAREVEDREMEGSILGNLGCAYARLGEIDEAIALLERALSIGRSLKHFQLIRTASEVLERLRSLS